MVKHQQTIAQSLGFVHEMGGQQNRFALLHERLQTLPHEVPRLRIEARGGFVQHEHLRLVDEGAGQTQAPLHAARQLARPCFGFAGERPKFQQGGDARFDVAITHPEIAPIHQQVFFGRKVGIKGVHLGHHPQTCLDGQGFFGHGKIAKISDAARIRRAQAQAHAQGGGFTCAIGANHAQTFAWRNVKRKPIHHGVVAKTFDEIFNIQ